MLIKMGLKPYLYRGVLSYEIRIKKYKVRENMTYYFSLAIHVWNFPLSSLTTQKRYFIFDKIMSCTLLLLSQQLLYLASILSEIMSNRWGEWRNKIETKHENPAAVFAIIYTCWQFKGLCPRHTTE